VPLPMSGLAVVTIGTSGVIALVPDAGGSSSSHSSSLPPAELPPGCEFRPFIGVSGVSAMLVGASLNGGWAF
jgi:hypothetical protein